MSKPSPFAKKTPLTITKVSKSSPFTTTRSSAAASTSTATVTTTKVNKPSPFSATNVTGQLAKLSISPAKTVNLPSKIVNTPSKNIIINRSTRTTVKIPTTFEECKTITEVETLLAKNNSIPNIIKALAQIVTLNINNAELISFLNTKIYPVLQPQLANLNIAQIAELLNYSAILKSDLWYQLLPYWEQNEEPLTIVEIFNIISAFGNKQSLDSPKLIRILTVDIKKYIPHFTVEHLAVILYSYMKLAYDPGADIINMFILEIEKKSQYLEILDILDIFSSFSYFEYYPDKYFINSIINRIKSIDYIFLPDQIVLLMRFLYQFNKDVSNDVLNVLVEMMIKQATMAKINIYDLVDFLVELSNYDYDLKSVAGYQELFKLFGVNKQDITSTVIIDTLAALYHFKIYDKALLQLFSNQIIQILENKSESVSLEDLVMILQYYTIWDYVPSNDMINILLQYMIDNYQDFNIIGFNIQPYQFLKLILRSLSYLADINYHVQPHIMSYFLDYIEIHKDDIGEHNMRLIQFYLNEINKNK